MLTRAAVMDIFTIRSAINDGKSLNPGHFSEKDTVGRNSQE